MKRTRATPRVKFSVLAHGGTRARPCVTSNSPTKDYVSPRPASRLTSGCASLPPYGTADLPACPLAARARRFKRPPSVPAQVLLSTPLPTPSLQYDPRGYLVLPPPKVREGLPFVVSHAPSEHAIGEGRDGRDAGRSRARESRGGLRRSACMGERMPVFVKDQRTEPHLKQGRRGRRGGDADHQRAARGSWLMSPLSLQTAVSARTPLVSSARCALVSRANPSSVV